MGACEGPCPWYARPRRLLAELTRAPCPTATCNSLPFLRVRLASVSTCPCTDPYPFAVYVIYIVITVSGLQLITRPSVPHPHCAVPPAVQAMCKYTTTGHWTPGGVRPPDEHWVNNAAMAVVRKQLRQRAAALAASGGGSSGSPPGGGGGGGGGSPGHSFGAGTGGGSVKGSPRVGGKAGGTRSPGGGAGKGVRASGIEPLAVEQMDGEMDVLFGLSARYKELRGMELQAEREQREVEWRADNGLDGPRPCMYQPRRFAPPPSGGQGGKGGKGGRPASAGAAVGRGGKPGWQDTASYL